MNPRSYLSLALLAGLAIGAHAETRQDTRFDHPPPLPIETPIEKVVRMLATPGTLLVVPGKPVPSSYGGVRPPPGKGMVLLDIEAGDVVLVDGQETATAGEVRDFHQATRREDPLVRRALDQIRRDEDAATHPRPEAPSSLTYYQRVLPGLGGAPAPYLRLLPTELQFFGLPVGIDPREPRAGRPAPEANPTTRTGLFGQGD